jgi:UDP-3-O-[3-hydroxymyristoyl] glucosamine N-acyltransferase
MGKKYGLLKYDTIKETGIVLYRIFARRTFNLYTGHFHHTILEGQPGGYIENDSNLSHEGLCWVGDSARIYGNARVVDNSVVYGNAMIYGSAVVSGNARIHGHADVGGAARIAEDANIPDQASVAGEARVAGNANIAGYANVYGNALVSGDATIDGETSVYGTAWICGNAHINRGIYSSGIECGEEHGEVLDFDEYEDAEE